MNEINNLLEKIRNAQYALESIPEPAQQEIEPLRHRNRELRRIWYERRAAYIDQIPHFWATTMMNHPNISMLLDDEEENCINHLTNLEVKEFGNGYYLLFYFDANPYFDNNLLVKGYFLNDEPNVSTAIEWKEGMAPSTQPQEAAVNSLVENREPEARSFFRWFINDTDPASEDIGELFKDLWKNPLDYYVIPDSESNEGASCSNKSSDEVDPREDNDQMAKSFLNNTELTSNCTNVSLGSEMPSCSGTVVGVSNRNGTEKDARRNPIPTESDDFSSFSDYSYDEETNTKKKITKMPMKGSKSIKKKTSTRANVKFVTKIPSYYIRAEARCRNGEIGECSRKPFDYRVPDKSDDDSSDDEEPKKGRKNKIAMKPLKSLKMKTSAHTNAESVSSTPSNLRTEPAVSYESRNGVFNESPPQVLYDYLIPDMESDDTGRSCGDSSEDRKPKKRGKPKETATKSSKCDKAKTSTHATTRTGTSASAGTNARAGTSAAARASTSGEMWSNSSRGSLTLSDVRKDNDGPRRRLFMD